MEQLVRISPPEERRLRFTAHLASLPICSETQFILSLMVETTAPISLPALPMMPLVLAFGLGFYPCMCFWLMLSCS